MLQVYQILAGLGSVLLMLITIQFFLRGKITLLEGIVWCLFWGIGFIIALFPDAVSVFIANTFGIKSNINAIIFMGIGFLFFVQFRLYLILKKQNAVISDLVRKIALRDSDENKS